MKTPDLQDDRKGLPLVCPSWKKDRLRHEAAHSHHHEQTRLARTIYEEDTVPISFSTDKLARAAYEAFLGDALGSGRPGTDIVGPCPWEALHPETQRGWHRAVDALYERFLDFQESAKEFTVKSLLGD